MSIEPSQKTAALAGAWASLGLVPFEFYVEQHPSASVMSGNLLWVVAIAVFFAVPSYFLVIGNRNQPFRQSQLLEPEHRARYAVIVRRMFIWFLAAAIVGILWTIVFRSLT